MLNDLVRKLDKAGSTDRVVVVDIHEHTNGVVHIA